MGLDPSEHDLKRSVIRMTCKTGDFREIDPEMAETLKDIFGRKNDAEIRLKSDGTYDVFEVERKKRKPRKKPTETE